MFRRCSPDTRAKHRWWDRTLDRYYLRGRKEDYATQTLREHFIVDHIGCDDEINGFGIRYHVEGATFEHIAVFLYDIVIA